MAELSDAERSAFQKTQAKRTKDDVAKSVAQAMEGEADQATPRGGGARPNGWLPDVLITPNARGAFELTVQGCAAIAAE